MTAVVAVVDDSRNAYKTFRPPIGQAAEQAQGSRARTWYHEAARNGWQRPFREGLGNAGAMPWTCSGWSSTSTGAT